MMSYLGADTVVEPIKDPIRLDPLLLWAKMKALMIEKLGIYKLPIINQPLLVDGKAFPLLRFVDANDLRLAWNKFSEVAQDQLKAKTGNTSTRVTDARIRFNNAFIDWTLEPSTDGRFVQDGKVYLPPAAVRDLIKIVDRFTIDLSTQAWAEQNILDTAYERAMDALDNTPGGGLIKAIMNTGVLVGVGVPAIVAGVATALDVGAKTVIALGDVVKFGTIGAGLFMLYWYVLRPEK